ncbi:hypothetical protein HIM_04869 [Hirsutella minnesotensis 3608]|uniref:Extracellular membrane protein CFEM domain-containing protein n=1 Tax=Hirsutella minnesotensis 3608 TaxID=1043627 RepID=A0A0F8A0Y8_9HYPO|nr:hypothetical protein HIM_04869 [Hirsutella minnesotensis 3608]
MKAVVSSSLLLLGLAGAKSRAASDVPFCLVECTEALTDQFSPAESLQVLCDDSSSQRALFQCLVDSCHAHAYGSALTHAVSTCSNMGLDISPLHPIEVHYATPVKRQVLPTELGPVIPSSIATASPPVLSFNHRLVMSLECNTGADGLLTLSVDASDSMATPLGISRDGNAQSVDLNNPAHTTARSGRYSIAFAPYFCHLDFLGRLVEQLHRISGGVLSFLSGAELDFLPSNRNIREPNHPNCLISDANILLQLFSTPHDQIGFWHEHKLELVRRRFFNQHVQSHGRDTDCRKYSKDQSCFREHHLLFCRFWGLTTSSAFRSEQLFLVVSGEFNNCGFNANFSTTLNSLGHHRGSCDYSGGRAIS